MHGKRRPALPLYFEDAYRHGQPMHIRPVQSAMLCAYRPAYITSSQGLEATAQWRHLMFSNDTGLHDGVIEGKSIHAIPCTHGESIYTDLFGYMRNGRRPSPDYRGMMDCYDISAVRVHNIHGRHTVCTAVTEWHGMTWRYVT